MTATNTNTPAGLSSAEVLHRRQRYGYNVFGHRKRLQPVLAFFAKFKSPLLLILIGVSLVAFFLGQRTDAVIIIAMVLLSGCMDYVNSYRSEKSVERLRAQVVTTAEVIREGREVEIPMRDVVPGDILLLSAGDIVPADGRVLTASDFFVNESALTGESFPVEKRAGAGEVKMGTAVVTGEAVAEALRTGAATEVGKIAAALNTRSPETAFERGIRQFSVFTVRVTLVLVCIVFGINIFLHRGVFDSFLFSIAIAVGLTPELLPVIMSISLSRGSVRMAKKGVIVKNLSAIESFGGMDVFCTDKTGTLTEDRIALVRCIDGEGRDSASVARHAFLNAAFHTAVKSPLDIAIKRHTNFPTDGYSKIAEMPFDLQRKRDSIVLDHAGERLMVTKGAPENIFAVCNHFESNEAPQAMTPAMHDGVQRAYERLSGEGYRVLAIASKNVSTATVMFSSKDEIAMTFVGFMAFLDPPKEGTRRAIDELEALGVEVKILTGDSEILTQKICRDLDVPVRGMLTGGEIAALSDDELSRLLPTTTIFARVTPDEKERIIFALQKAGAAVGYLGDGVNDAPALKAADVGISVNNAVDVAKETADIILVHKSLDVLHDGIAEGRKTFQNTMKYILMGLSSNFGNMVSMTAASALLPFLPMLPAQILLNNFLYDLSQVTLTTDTVDTEDVKRPPRWDIGFVKKYMLVFGPLSSFFDFLTFGFLFLFLRLTEHGFQAGWFIESLTTQVLVIFIIRTKRIPFLQSAPSRVLFLNALVVVLIAWLLPLTKVAGALKFAHLPTSALLGLVVIILVYLFAAEGAKQFFYRHLRQAQQKA